jgi:hypothetical protein
VRAADCFLLPLRLAKRRVTGSPFCSWQQTCVCDMSFSAPQFLKQRPTPTTASVVATAPNKPPAQSLASRLGIDVLAAMCTSLCVSPIVATIDKAVCDAAVGRSTMRQSVLDGFKLLLTRPHVYLTSKSFSFVFLLYTSTYATANITRTIAKDEQGIDPAMPALIMTTCINIPIHVRVAPFLAFAGAREFRRLWKCG